MPTKIYSCKPTGIPCYVNTNAKPETKFIERYIRGGYAFSESRKRDIERNKSIASGIVTARQRLHDIKQQLGDAIIPKIFKF